MLELLNALPVAPWVAVHSIIGDRGESGPMVESSDGVVAYASGHLAGAASELVVPAGHRAFEDPAARSEIQRILALP